MCTSGPAAFRCWWPPCGPDTDRPISSPSTGGLLAALTPAQRTVIEAAAVLGENVDEHILAAVVARRAGSPVSADGRHDASVADALAAAWRGGLLAVEAANRSYRFAHALVRDGIVDRLDPATARALHVRRRSRWRLRRTPTGLAVSPGTGGTRAPIPVPGERPRGGRGGRRRMPGPPMLMPTPPGCSPRRWPTCPRWIVTVSSAPSC